jgi:acetylornithine deacetylase
MTSMDATREEAVLAALDTAALEADAARLVRVPSTTGDERAVVERFAEIASGYGLRVAIREHELDAVQRADGYPGGVAPRETLFGATATLPATSSDAPRFCLNGHLDVVPPGPLAWRLDPWSGVVEDGRLHGRGSLDMKAGVAAALHSMLALREADVAHGEVVLQAVASEEDGGAGTFAALLDDADFAAALIPEPTGLAVACAHGGSLQFEVTIFGRSTHAATRLEGVSALDRYVPLHLALKEHERRINADVAHELMRRLELPYPINVGRLEVGEWPAQVPDRLRFAGRLGVPVGSSTEAARAEFVGLLESVLGAGPQSFELAWLGAFRPSSTPVDDRLVTLARDALTAELGRPAELVGVPWGADFQHFAARGIPCVMLGTRGIERAHGVDEFVDLAEVATVARAIARILVRYWDGR